MPGHNSKHNCYTIREQRQRILEHLEENPSLKPDLRSSVPKTKRSKQADELYPLID